MASSLLPVIASNADHQLQAALGLHARRQLPSDRMYMIWKAYRVRGICMLFLECDQEAFHKDLQRSAVFFLHYLKDISTPDDLVTSEANPFFDALACKDLSSARQIAHHARASWNEGEEYEDDFLYVHFLMQLVLTSPEADSLRQILVAFEQVLDGEDSARFDLCEALVARDEAAFDEALSSVLQEHEEQYLEGVEAGYIIEEEWATEGALFIEGLGLVSLAEELGIPVQDNYLFIPSLGRAIEPLPFNPNAWRIP